MKTDEIAVHISNMTIIKHYLDEAHLTFDAYRVGWEGGNGVPFTPIAIRIGRSNESGGLYLGDLRPNRYVSVDHDKDFYLVQAHGSHIS